MQIFEWWDKKAEKSALSRGQWRIPVITHGWVLLVFKVAGSQQGDRTGWAGRGDREQRYQGHIIVLPSLQSQDTKAGQLSGIRRLGEASDRAWQVQQTAPQFTVKPGVIISY